jgi:hypothetical protein
VVALLARLAGSLAAVTRLRRRTTELTAPAWLDSLDHWRRQLGLRGRVALLQSPSLAVPVVVGLWRPAVIVPQSLACRADAGLISAVLLHELAHVRRRDYAWNLVLRLVRVLYWPHPLAWSLTRAVSSAREAACDAFCVGALGDRSLYGQTLLEVAASLVARPSPSNSPALGMAMARSLQLATRLDAIAQTAGSPRCLPAWPLRTLLTLLALATAGFLGTIEFTRALAAAPPSPIKQDPHADPVLKLRIVAALDGQPIPHARVRLTLPDQDDREQSADDQGQLDIVLPFPNRQPDPDHWLSALVWADRFAAQIHHWGFRGDPIPPDATIRLHPGESLGGLVQDDQGRPIGGAQVFVACNEVEQSDPSEVFDISAVTVPDGRWSAGGAPRSTGKGLVMMIRHPDFLSDSAYNRSDASIDALRAGTQVSVMKKGVPIEGRVLDPEGQPVAGATVLATDSPRSIRSELKPFAVTTDADGRYRTWQCAPGRWYVVAVKPGHGPGMTLVNVAGTDLLQVDLRLTRPKPLTVRVTDPEGQPIAGAWVLPDTWRGFRGLGVNLHTDATGRAVWPDAPEGDPLDLYVGARGYRRAGEQMVTVQPGETETLITLVPTVAINGSVRDRATGKRVPGIGRVEIGAVKPGTDEVEAWTLPTQGVGASTSNGMLSVFVPASLGAWKLRITFDGYAPFVSRTFRAEETSVEGYQVVLTPPGANAAPGDPAPIEARAVRPDGSPLANARVYVTTWQISVKALDGGLPRLTDEKPEIRADANGSFRFWPPSGPPYALLILGDDAYALVGQEAFQGPGPHAIRTTAYSRIEGQCFVGAQPQAGAQIKLIGNINRGTPSRRPFVFSAQTTADANGRFVFDHVLPFPLPGVRLARVRHTRSGNPNRTYSVGEFVAVEPGRTTTVTLGGKGRPVIGRVEVPTGWSRPVDFARDGFAILRTDGPEVPLPIALTRGHTSTDDVQWPEWLDSWQQSPEGAAAQTAYVRTTVELAPDGSFRFDDVPSGAYRVVGGVIDHGGPEGRGSSFAHVSLTFVVPPLPPQIVRSDEPLDAGTIRLAPRVALKPGDPAPRIEVTTIDGRHLTIPDDFHGKALVLDFGALWSFEARLQLVQLNAIRQKFQSSDQVAQLSLVMAPDDPATRAFIADKAQPWPQAIIGPQSNPITAAYGIEANNGSALVLIGPDGRIAVPATYNLQPEAITQAINPAP